MIIKKDETTTMREIEMTGAIPTQTATAVFQNGVFAYCEFTTEKRPYSLSDWLFLHDVADAICESGVIAKFGEGVYD